MIGGIGGAVSTVGVGTGVLGAEAGPLETVTVAGFRTVGAPVGLRVGGDCCALVSKADILAAREMGCTSVDASGAVGGGSGAD